MKNKANFEGFVQIILIIVLLLVGFGFYFYKMQNKNLLKIIPTFTATPKAVSLKDRIKYTIPQGWSEKSVDSSSVVLQSNDTEYSDTGFYTSGAHIYLYPPVLKPRVSLKEAVDSQKKDFEKWEYSYPKLKIGGSDVVKIHLCWEGCADTYYFKSGDYLWYVSYGCSDKDCTRKNIDLDNFLKSIKVL